MAKTLVDVPAETLARAAEVLGTRTKKDTITRALEMVVAQGAMAELIAWARSGDLAGLDDPDVIRDATR
jgi:Arc/MetJ family transcription regulator